MKPPALLESFLLALFTSQLLALPENPVFTFSLRGPCGEVIEGPAGVAWDDGTGGAPDFKKGRPGHVFEIYLSQDRNMHSNARTQSWSWAVGVEGPFIVTDVTLDGTISCYNGMPQCLGEGFFRSELTGPPYGKGPPENHGALSYLYFDEAKLPGAGDYLVGKIRVTAQFSPTEGDNISGRIFFTSRVSAGGGTVPTKLDYVGTTISESNGNPPLVLKDCSITLKSVSPIAQFLRCDATNDGEVDISDPIRTLTELFLGGPMPACRAAADCNGDGRRDISDAVYALSFLFLGSPPPPAPFPECGRTEETTKEDCPWASTTCR